MDPILEKEEEEEEEEDILHCISYYYRYKLAQARCINEHTNLRLLTLFQSLEHLALSFGTIIIINGTTALASLTGFRDG
jgi:hypothetical protein